MRWFFGGVLFTIVVAMAAEDESIDDEEKDPQIAEEGEEDEGGEDEADHDARRTRMRRMPACP